MGSDGFTADYHLNCCLTQDIQLTAFNIGRPQTTYPCTAALFRTHNTGDTL